MASAASAINSSSSNEILPRETAEPFVTGCVSQKPSLGKEKSSLVWPTKLKYIHSMNSDYMLTSMFITKFFLVEMILSKRIYRKQLCCCFLPP